VASPKLRPPRSLGLFLIVTVLWASLAFIEADRSISAGAHDSATCFLLPCFRALCGSREYRRSKLVRRYNDYFNLFLIVVRLKLPKELRRSLACTNIAENVIGTIRRVTRNLKRWRDASIALRWLAAGMIEANKGFRRLKAHKQLSVLRAALQAHHNHITVKPVAHVTRAA
jgi:hypothetical protein